MSMLPLILFTVFTNAVAQLMLKQGMITVGAIDLAAGNIVLKAISVLLNPWVVAGLVVFVVSMVTHLYVLSKVELSFAHPFLSLAFVAVAIVAWLVWGENLNPLRIAGIALICCGTVLIAQGGEARDPGAGVVVGADPGSQS